MASEIRDTSSTEAAKAREPGSEVAESDPPVVLAGPRTTVTPRTVSAPRGKIFEDELRGTVFWEVAESSDDEDDDPESESKANDNWGNPFRIDWFKWYITLKCSSDWEGIHLFRFCVQGCSEIRGTATGKSKSLVMARKSNQLWGHDS